MNALPASERTENVRSTTLITCNWFSVRPELTDMETRFACSDMGCEEAQAHQRLSWKQQWEGCCRSSAQSPLNVSVWHKLDIRNEAPVDLDD